MIIWLIRALLHTLANAVGLLVATAILSGFSINARSLVVVTLIFTAVEVIAGPLLVSISVRNIPALTGGVALVTTFVGLLITDYFSDGLNISGVSTWLLASLIVWVSALLAGVILPLFLFKKTLAARRKA
jgi:putative membrane protein